MQAAAAFQMYGDGEDELSVAALAQILGKE
jgi:hypothetical protein